MKLNIGKKITGLEIMSGLESELMFKGLHCLQGCFRKPTCRELKDHKHQDQVSVHNNSQS